MEPNDLPIVCLPLELSGDDAAALIDFLYQLIEALERHYGGLLINGAHEPEASCSPQPGKHSARRAVVLTPSSNPAPSTTLAPASTPFT